MTLTNADKQRLPIGSRIKMIRNLGNLAGQYPSFTVYTVTGRRNTSSGLKLQLLSERGLKVDDVDFEAGPTWMLVEEAA